MKRITAAVAAVAVMLALSVSVIAANAVLVTINGEKLDYVYDNGTRAEAYADGGVTYLPLRAIAEALGFSVSWNADTNTAAVKTDRLDLLESSITGGNYLPSDAVNKFFSAYYDKNGAVAYAVSSDKLRAETFDKLSADNWRVMDGVDMVDYTFDSHVDDTQTDFEVSFCTSKVGVFNYRTVNVGTVKASDKNWRVDSVEYGEVKYVAYIEGDTLYVDLRENPTTGYTWSVTPPAGFTLASDDYAQDSASEEMTGVGGTRSYAFKYAGTGKAGDAVKLNFVNGQSWSEQDTDTVCTVYCTVGADKTLAIEYIAEGTRANSK